MSVRRGIAPITVKVSESADKGLLKHVLSLFFILDDPEPNVVHGPRIQLVKPLMGGLIPGPASRNEVLVYVVNLVVQGDKDSDRANWLRETPANTSKIVIDGG